MFYALLGRVVWFAGKWFVRRKYGSVAPKAGLAAGVLAVVVAALLFARRNGGE